MFQYTWYLKCIVVHERVNTEFDLIFSSTNLWHEPRHTSQIKVLIKLSIIVKYISGQLLTCFYIILMIQLCSCESGINMANYGCPTHCVNLGQDGKAGNIIAPFQLWSKKILMFPSFPQHRKQLWPIHQQIHYIIVVSTFFQLKEMLP